MGACLSQFEGVDCMSVLAGPAVKLLVSIHVCVCVCVCLFVCVCVCVLTYVPDFSTKVDI